MSAEAMERDAVFAWDPGIDGAVISIPVEALSHDGGPTAIARVGVEDERTYLEQADGLRVFLAEISLDDVLEALHMGVVMVREFEDDGAGRTREYHVESLAPAQAPGM
jgi:hypothetical protein